MFVTNCLADAIVKWVSTEYSPTPTPWLMRIVLRKFHSQYFQNISIAHLKYIMKHKFLH